MPIIIKCDLDLAADDIFTSEPVWVYENCELNLGDEVFVWLTKPNREREGLAARGSLVEIRRERVTRGPGVALTVKINEKQAGRIVTTENLRQYDVRNPKISEFPHHPLHELCRKLYANSHQKVASLESDEADYLRGFFDRLVDARSELDDIEAATSELAAVSDTQRDALIKARLGQGRFRADLFRYWESCAVLGNLPTDFLLASHIKPWRVCNNQERLDPYNGLLLSPALNLAFDQGFISFGQDGKICFSHALDHGTAWHLGLRDDLKLRKLSIHVMKGIFNGTGPRCFGSNATPTR